MFTTSATNLIVLPTHPPHRDKGFSLHLPPPSDVNNVIFSVRRRVIAIIVQLDFLRFLPLLLHLPSLDQRPHPSLLLHLYHLVVETSVLVAVTRL